MQLFPPHGNWCFIHQKKNLAPSLTLCLSLFLDLLCSSLCSVKPMRVLYVCAVASGLSFRIRVETRTVIRSPEDDRAGRFTLLSSLSCQTRSHSSPRSEGEGCWQDPAVMVWLFARWLLSVRPLNFPSTFSVTAVAQSGCQSAWRYICKRVYVASA